MGKKARSTCSGGRKNERQQNAGVATRSQPRARTGRAAAAQTRIDTLPDDLLTSILRRVGARTARQVCRRWHAAYGPLHGLYLRHLPTRRDLMNLVPHPPTAPLARIHALYLPPPAPRAPFSSAVLSALPATFPTLRTLHLQTSVPLMPPQVPLLAPLAPRLTALTLALATPKAAARLPAALPSLRSLTLHLALGTPLHAHLAALAQHLPTLHYLSITPHSPHPHRHPTATAPAPEILPLLSLASSLTSLHLRSTYLSAWDRPSLTLLSTAWPRLASLHLGLDPAPPSTPRPAAAPHPTPDDLITALATRTALTSLTLNSPPAPFHHLAALSNLASLTLLPNPPAYSHTATHRVVSCLSAVSPAGRLTRLTIRDSSVHLTAQALFTLNPLAPTLRHFSFMGLVAPFHDLYPLAHLTALQSLRLHHTGSEPEPPPGLFALPSHDVARSIGTALPHLTSLTLLDNRFVWPVDALLSAVACHGRLRHFQLDRYLPHLAALLAPTRDTLTRLAVTLAPAHVSAALQSLTGMAGLRALLVTLDISNHFLKACNLAPLGTLSTRAPGTGTPGAATPAHTPPQPAGPSPDSPLAPTTPGACTRTAATAAAATRLADPGASTGAAAESTGASTSTRSSTRARRAAGTCQPPPRRPPPLPLLPPGLQVLVINLQQLEACQRAEVEGAAAARGCVVWERAREAEYDDCNGCLEGAAAGFCSHREAGGGLA